MKNKFNLILILILITYKHINKFCFVVPMKFVLYHFAKLDLKFSLFVSKIRSTFPCIKCKAVSFTKWLYKT